MTTATAQPGVDARGDERAEHPALGAADAAGQREQVAELPEEVAEDDVPTAGGSPNAWNVAQSVAMSNAHQTSGPMRMLGRWWMIEIESRAALPATPGTVASRVAIRPRRPDASPSPRRDARRRPGS